MFNDIIGQAQNDFLITFSDRDWSSEWQDLFSKQTVATKINLVSATVTVGIRQLRAGKIQDIIFHLITKHGRTLDMMRIRPVKSKKHGAEYVFLNGELKDHRTILDYRSKADIVHFLTFTFSEVKLHSPTAAQPAIHYAENSIQTIDETLDSIANLDENDMTAPEIMKTNHSEKI